MAVSLAAAWMLESTKQNRQMWIVPGGLGKSRILIGMMIALALKQPNPKFTKFLIVYNHEQLCKQDEAKLNDVAKL